jgi:hypothetical protein
MICATCIAAQRSTNPCVLLCADCLRLCSAGWYIPFQMYALLCLLPLLLQMQTVAAATLAPRTPTPTAPAWTWLPLGLATRAPARMVHLGRMGAVKVRWCGIMTVMMSTHTCMSCSMWLGTCEHANPVS